MRTPEPIEFLSDVFISYSHVDTDWVHNVLLPRLEAGGLKVHIDSRDFVAGAPFMTNMENAVKNSRHMVVVLTPDWAASDYAQFEGLLVQSKDPIGRKRRLVPIMLRDCQPSLAIAQLTYRDFRNQTKWDAEWPLLFRDLGADNQRAGELSERGILALIDLMQTPAVRGAVYASRNAFQAVSQQIIVLGCYKALHDAFQRMEDGYNMVLQIKKRMPADPSGWLELDLYFTEFHAGVQNLLDLASQTPFAANEVLWTQRLEYACRELQASIENKDLDQLTLATGRINQILGREPSRLNNALVTTAQNLQLAAFVQTLATIRDSLITMGLQGRNIQQLQEFRRGVDALGHLHLGLNSAIRVHSTLQAIYDELYPINPLLFRDLREFENIWAVQRLSVQSLKSLGDSEWIRNLCALVQQVEEALTIARNLVKVLRFFQDYRYKLSRAFNQADEDLLSICGELKKVGTLLTSLLQGGMEHE